jgi:DhnA family fructose-bisphosphate aldolase class Ia
MARQAIADDAAGIVYGRNVICAQDPESYLDCLLDVVKGGMPPEEAENKYLSSLK